MKNDKLRLTAIFVLIVSASWLFACSSEEKKSRGKDISEMIDPYKKGETSVQKREVPEAPESSVKKQSSEREKASDEKLDIAARINGTPIPMSRVDEEVEKLTNKFHEKMPQLKFSEAQLKNMQKDFLNRIIQKEVLLGECDRRNIAVTEEEIDSKIDGVKKLFGDSPEAKKRFEEGIDDMEKFREEVRKQARIDKLLNQIVPEELGYTDDDLKAFFEENKERFQERPKAKVEQIFIKFDETDEASKEEAEKRAEEILQELKSGGNFNELAKKHSDDTQTAEKGGDMGYVEKGRLFPQFDEVVFSIELNKISDIIETSIGYHIIRVLERTEPEEASFEDMKEQVEKTFKHRKTKTIKDEFIEKMKNEADIEIYL